MLTPRCSLRSLRQAASCGAGAAQGGGCNGPGTSGGKGLARSMSQRLLVADGVTREVTVSTLHSFCHRHLPAWRNKLHAHDFIS